MFDAFESDCGRRTSKAFGAAERLDPKQKLLAAIQHAQVSALNGKGRGKATKEEFVGFVESLNDEAAAPQWRSRKFTVTAENRGGAQEKRTRRTRTERKGVSKSQRKAKAKENARRAKRNARGAAASRQVAAVASTVGIMAITNERTEEETTVHGGPSRKSTSVHGSSMTPPVSSSGRLCWISTSC